MAHKTGKIFNAGALQSIIDNISLTFDYDFQGAPTTNYVDVNPVPFCWGEDPKEENVNTGSGSTAPADKKATDQATTTSTNTSTGGTDPTDTTTASSAWSAELEALKKYENCWGTMGSPICSRYKV